jgi:hypothetical protein
VENVIDAFMIAIENEQLAGKRIFLEVFPVCAGLILRCSLILPPFLNPFVFCYVSCLFFCLQQGDIIRITQQKGIEAVNPFGKVAKL